MAAGGLSRESALNLFSALPLANVARSLPVSTISRANGRAVTFLSPKPSHPSSPVQRLQSSCSSSTKSHASGMGLSTNRAGIKMDNIPEQDKRESRKDDGKHPSTPQIPVAVFVATIITVVLADAAPMSSASKSV